jgi:hypothetical protein
VAELFRTNDLALIAVTEAILADSAIPYQVADRHASIIEGSLRFIQMRVLVDDARIDEARQLMRDADLGEWVAD